MSPEIVAALVQFGSTGLLGLVLYFGLQQMGKVLDNMNNALAKSQADNHELQMALISLLSKVEPKTLTLDYPIKNNP